MLIHDDWGHWKIFDIRVLSWFTGITNHTIEFIVHVKIIQRRNQFLWSKTAFDSYFSVEVVRFMEHYNRFMYKKIYFIHFYSFCVCVCGNLHFWNQRIHVYLYFGKSDILRFDPMYIGNIKGNSHCKNLIFINANIPVLLVSDH